MAVILADNNIVEEKSIPSGFDFQLNDVFQDDHKKHSTIFYCETKKDSIPEEPVSSGSIFSEIIDFPNYKKIQQNNFNNLIHERIDYIKNLNNLPSNWISGKSDKPNSLVLIKSICLLESLCILLKSNNSYSIPDLLMGPIPSGGFGFEIIINNDKKILVSIFNTNTCELEYLANNFFFEKEVNLNSLILEFLNIYKSIDSIYV